MEKLKTYEDFELEDFKGGQQKVKESRSKAKIIILFSLIIIFEIIYIISISSLLRTKNSQLTLLNFKKYLLDDGNEKLYQELNDDRLTSYSLDEELETKEKEINTKEEQIIKYKKKSNYLLQNFSPTPESILNIQKENDKKKLKINELKLILYDIDKQFKEEFNTKIIDSRSELNKIQSIINRNNLNDFKLCYSGENNEYNFTEAYDKCDLKQDIPFLIVFQTSLYERYGIYLSTKKENKPFIFSLTSRKKLESEYIEINNFQRQSLIYLINLIKKMKTNNNNNKDKENNDMKDFDITDLEIFHI